MVSFANSNYVNVKNNYMQVYNKTIAYKVKEQERENVNKRFYSGLA